MNYRSYENLVTHTRDRGCLVQGSFDFVIGIPRSGVFAASMIALQKNLPLIDPESFLLEKTASVGRTRLSSDLRERLDTTNASSVLVVDDSVASGRSMAEVVGKIKKHRPNVRVTTLAIYASHSSKKYVDIYFDICPMPRVFEWNIFHRKSTKNMDFDLDGVLCKDPSEIENDDGILYLDFLRHAPVRYKPTFGVGNIVTSRLEKYRTETERWLFENGIDYERLIMLNLTTARERQRRSGHAEYKANFYIDSESELFVESDREQAVKICRITSKPVLCTDTQELFSPGIRERLFKKNARRNMLKIIYTKASLAFQRIVLRIKNREKRVL